MRIVSTSYNNVLEFHDPQEWLKRISFYTGILEQLAVQNEVISIEHINYEGELLQNDVRYYFISQKSKTKFFPYEKHRLIKKMKPDVVIINGLIYPLQIIQLRLCLNKAAKIILFHRAEKPFKGWRKYLQKLVDKCVNAYLFASSEFGTEWIQRGIIGNEKKIYEVMHASSFFYPENKCAARTALSIKGTPVFLWVGRLDINKDPITVVKAFIRFVSLQPLARLYMIYQTSDLLPELLDLMKADKKAAEAIKLIGKIEHPQLQTWYSSADFIISASHYEGGGIAVSEGMSCGCIPILPNIISFRRLTGSGKCGLLYEPGSREQLLAALLQTGQMNWEEESEKTLQQFADELSFEAIAEKIEKVNASL